MESQEDVGNVRLRPNEVHKQRRVERKVAASFREKKVKEFGMQDLDIGTDGENENTGDDAEGRKEYERLLEKQGKIGEVVTIDDSTRFSGEV